MRIHIKTDIGYRGVELPRQFRLDGREVEVIENVDQWPDCDYRYFKVKGDDGNLCILRFNEGRADWELTMFQNPRAQTVRDAGQRWRRAMATPGSDSMKWRHESPRHITA